jgi:hypothetical protein
VGEQFATKPRKDALARGELYSRVINILTGSLEGLVRQHESFRENCIPEFFGEDDMKLLVNDIRRNFHELREFLFDLQALRKQCDSHISEVIRLSTSKYTRSFANDFDHYSSSAR